MYQNNAPHDLSGSGGEGWARDLLCIAASFTENRARSLRGSGGERQGVLLYPEQI